MKRSLIIEACFLISVATAGTAPPRMPIFFARYDYPPPAQNTSFVQVADTNGDAIPDLIELEIPESLSPTSVSVQVLLGNGGGTFRPGPHTTVANVTSRAFTAADLNGDGKVDLAMTGSYSDEPTTGVFAIIGNGDGTFRLPSFYPIDDDGLGPNLVVGDFNGDRIPDIATAGSQGVWLLTGKGNGTFNPAVHVAGLPLGSSFQIAAADFNQDLKLDLVVSLSNGIEAGVGFLVFLGNGNGSFQSPQVFTRPRGVNAIAVGSLTRGAAPSIVFATGLTNYVDIYFSDGAGGFLGPRSVVLSNVAYFNTGLAIGDMNGDGVPDIVSSTGDIVYGKADGSFSEPINHPSGGGNVVLADLRNNGRLDIVTGAVSVVLNEGQGEFEDGVWTPVAGAIGCSVTADFNGDGKPDLAVNTAQGISILFGTGVAASPFMVGPSISLSTTACPYAGDLNGDQIPDLLLVDGEAVHAYLGNGDGSFTLKSTTPVGPSAALVLGDFNHDGKLDFAVSGNALALGNGDGTFQNPTPFMSNPPSSGFSGIVAGDINNDGWPDLVLTNSGYPVASNAYVMLNNRQGGFTEVPANFGAGTSSPSLGDLNNDGNLDLILMGASGASVYLGDGKGDFTFQVTLPPGGGLNAVIADVNGDGIQDLLIPGYNRVAVYAGTGQGAYRGPRYYGTGPMSAGLLVENLHGQSPAGGLPDIVSPDESGGVRVLINLTP